MPVTVGNGCIERALCRWLRHHGYKLHVKEGSKYSAAIVSTVYRTNIQEASQAQ